MGKSSFLDLQFYHIQNFEISPVFKVSCFKVVLFFNAVFAIFAALS